MEECYFPSNALSTIPYWDKFLREWCSKFLKAMSEPNLTDLELKGREVYRFLWLRTFHRPIAVRVERQDDKCTLLAKELNGAGGYEPGMISKQVSKSIPPKDWKMFLLLLRNIRFWELLNKGELLPVDGAFWILEGARSSKYHVVNRYSPQADGTDSAFREVCLYLLNLAGTEVDPSEVY